MRLSGGGVLGGKDQREEGWRTTLWEASVSLGAREDLGGHMHASASR